MPYSNPQN